MEIKFHREQYINNPCPSLTKEMMDWFYQRLYFAFRDRIDVRDITEIKQINVRINQAYRGCHIIHFYIKIDNHDEFHMQYESLNFGTLHKERYDWICDFIELGGIDMGTTRPLELKELRNQRKREKMDTRSRVKKLRTMYESYMRFKEFFNYD
jgi:hypothetical protein